MRSTRRIMRAAGAAAAATREFAQQGKTGIGPRNPCGTSPACPSLPNRPEKNLLAVYIFLSIRHPVSHVPIVRDDAASGPELSQKLGSQARVHRRNQVKSDDRSAVQIGREQVRDLETHAGSHSGLVRMITGAPDQLRVEVNANAVSVKILRRHGHNASVPASEIVDDIAPGNAGEPQHGGGHIV